MNDHESHAVARFRARLGALLVIRHGLAALTLWAFLAGTAVLALRGAVGLDRASLLWGLLTLPVALAPAVVLALRRLPPPQAVRAVLDRSSGCGGLLMAGAETPVGDWGERLPALRAPRLRWQGGKAWALLAGGVAFVLLALLVPQGLADLGAGPRLDVGRDTARLKQQIDVLKDEKVVEPKRADDLKSRLDEMRRDAQGREPARTLEALDALKDVVKKAARDAAEGAARKNETLGKAEALAGALKKKASELDSKSLADGLSELAALSRKAAAENEAMQAGLDPELMEALKAGTLSQEQLDKLLGALGDCKGDIQGKLGRLRIAGLLDLEALEECEKAGECDCDALEAYLCKNGCKKLASSLCNNPGRGGITRGPGAAEITFDGESSADGVKFKPEALPQAALRALKESQRVGLSGGAPKPDRAGAGKAEVGALDGAAAAGGSATTQVVLPRHRGAVERYFDRPAK